MIISTNSGLHSVRPEKPRYQMIDAMSFFQEAGFQGVDINFCPIIYEGLLHEPILNGDWKTRLNEIKQKFEKYGMKATLSHAPYFNIAKVEKAKLDHYLKAVELSIEAAAYVGATWIVIHPQNVWENEKNQTDVNSSIEFLKPFCELGKKFRIGIAVENLHCTALDRLIEIVDGLGENAGVCWDTGHGNLKGIKQDEAILSLGTRLKALHIHDNYGTKDNHLVPFFGNIDWSVFMKSLSRIGFSGAFNFEVNVPYLPESVRMAHAKYLVSVAQDLLKLNSVNLLSSDVVHKVSTYPSSLSREPVHP